MIDKVFKKFEHEEKEQKKCQLEIKREEAKEKASVLWRKMKEIKEQKAAEEKNKTTKVERRRGGQTEMQGGKRKGGKTT